MKLLKLFIAVFLAGVFLFSDSSIVHALDPYRSLCVGIQGRFNANSTWKGGSIMVGCAGDDGGSAPSQSQACTGEVQTVRPGQLFRLTRCSCFGSDKGCLKIGKELKLEPLVDGKRRVTVVRRIDETPAFINNSCRVSRTGEVCGSNGQQISGNVKITCSVSSSPIPTTPLPSGVTPTACPTPGQVTNVKITCPDCFDANLTPTEPPGN